jgi:hypothetical protein
MRRSTERREYGLGLLAAPATSAGDAASLVVQATGDGTAVLDYITFVPLATLLLLTVAIRRYVFADEDLPWWVTPGGMRDRVRLRVPQVRTRAVTGVRSDGGDSTGPLERATGALGAIANRQESTGTESAGDDNSIGAGRSASDGRSADSRSEESGPRGTEPVPDRLALTGGDQRVLVGDGDTVDEEIRAMLRAAGEGDYAKWIDDRHLHFIRDEHGFTMVVDGENLTRLDGERMRAGDRARVSPGDVIELSGVVTLSVERP